MRQNRLHIRVTQIVAAYLLIQGVLIPGERVFAVSADLENAYTGTNSENTNTVSTRENISFSISSDSAIGNNADIDAQTGDVSVSNSTAVGNINTGNVRGELELENQASAFSPSVDFASTSNSVDVQAENTVTGPDSVNTNEVNANNSYRIDRSQSTRIANDINANLRTGDVSIDEVTRAGNIRTGDIVFAVKVFNEANVVKEVAKPDVSVPTPKPTGGQGGGEVVPTPVPTSSPESEAKGGAPEAPKLVEAVMRMAAVAPTERQFFPVGSDAALPLIGLIAAWAASLLRQKKEGDV